MKDGPRRPALGAPPGSIPFARAGLLLTSVWGPHFVRSSPLAVTVPTALHGASGQPPTKATGGFRGVRDMRGVVQASGCWVFPPAGTLGFTEMPGHLVLLEMLFTDV